MSSLADRETNDLWFGYPEPAPERDEEGHFAVRAVFLDGVDRNQSLHTSLLAALGAADEYRAEMRGKGYDRHRLHVGVIDEDDPERGELDYEDIR